MKKVVGETKSLRASDKSALEKIASKKTNPHGLIDPVLLKRGASISASLGRQIGLLIGRDGRVEWVIVGSKHRIYLPDLGRFRLERARLRRLRLVVFLPDGEERVKLYPHQSLMYGRASTESSTRRGKERQILSPEIPADLITDLVKLRLDSLLAVAVEASGKASSATLAYLDIQSHASGAGFNSNVASRGPDVAFYHTQDVYELDLDFNAFVADLESAFSGSIERGFDTSKDTAILVGAYVGKKEEAEASMRELYELADTAGIQVVDSTIQRRKRIDPKTLIGAGKVEELMLHCLDVGADLVVFDRELSPGQLRSISKLTELRVIDRSMLILDIFAQRAKTSEGRLQVELAQLKYSLPRLTETDTGLSRLTGGIGGRGPGETKLEIGRRRARDRIADLEKQIDKVADRRELRRSRRKERGVPVIAIVGYTNAGKSTLLNSLTKGDVFVEDKLFATLDPSTRRMRFPNDREVVFVDTVGFIRELPKELMNAFRATLEEVGDADVLIHLVDASDPEMKQQISVVEQTLGSLGYGDKPKILVLNKIDLLSAIESRTLSQSLDAFAISAAKRTGFEELLGCLQERLAESFTGRDPGGFVTTSAV